MQSWLRELRRREEALLQLHVNMKSLVGILLGSLLALVIGCAAKSAPRSTAAPTATAAEQPPEPAAVGGSATPQSEIKLLDEQISDDMAKLSLTRPTAQPMTCTGADCKQQLSGAAVAAEEPSPPTCKPKGDTCTQACTIKDSICKNATRICQLAIDLGGNDAYANDKCSSGNASCEAAKQRCCGCL